MLEFRTRRSYDGYSVYVTDAAQSVVLADGLTEVEASRKVAALRGCIDRLPQTTAVSPGVPRRPAYFIGASGVGKSTLAQWVSRTYNRPLITGATRKAMTELGLTDWGPMKTDVDLADKYQRLVWQHQQEMESLWSRDGVGEPFVSDRGLDHLAYISYSGTLAAEIAFDPAFREYCKRMAAAHVFFVRPHPAVQAARDGRRDEWLEPALVHSIDGKIQLLLEMFQVPYITLSCPSLRDRIRTVQAVLEAPT